MNTTTTSRRTDQSRLEMRWLPVTDEATGRTHMEAVWISVGSAPAAAHAA